MRWTRWMCGLVYGLMALTACTAAAAVKLPAVIGDNMVLQRGQAVPIWGWANQGEQVTVRLAGQSVSAKADDAGRWKLALAKLDAGGPLDMTVEAASGSQTVKNILVGEVWVCSGQSNMEMGIAAADNREEEVAKANYPNIRLFTVPVVSALEPATDVTATWYPCNPKTVVKKGVWGGFSAAGYYFGRKLHKELNVPIGLIQTSCGGTPAEVWVSRKGLASRPELKDLVGGDSSRLYNAMVAPLMPFAIRGVIWYQGESNVSRAQQYRTLFPTLIRSWRAEWGQGEFPFLFVQIAPFLYDASPLWEAQLFTLKSVPNTGMVVTTDLVTEIEGIHPTNKQEVGRRLALWALAKTYGRDVAYSGPIYKSMKIEGRNIRISFDHGTGMKSSDGKQLSYFGIAGANHFFLPANVQIDGDTLVISAPFVDNPLAVRFAQEPRARPNLVNKAGLPASPFRTDNW